MSSATTSRRVPSLRTPRLPTLRHTLIVVGGWAVCCAVFAALCAALGADPGALVMTMLNSSVLTPDALSQTLLRAVPITLAALAVAIPARAGLVNVGGEGQLIMGAVAATWMGLGLGAHLPSALGIVATMAAGAVAGAVWAGICGALRVWLDVAEAVTTLLMNFIANDVMLFLIYQPWKDPSGSGQPQSRPLSGGARLATWSGPLAINASVVVAVVVTVLTWWLVTRTRWGFTVRVAGANPDAAHRHGLNTGRLMLTAMLVGGALAGLGGALNLMGVEGQLRPGITTSYGYTAFMACFVARYRPLRVIAIAIGFSAIVLAGNGLQINQGLDGNIVTVLLGLIVLTHLLLRSAKTGTTT